MLGRVLLAQGGKTKLTQYLLMAALAVVGAPLVWRTARKAIHGYFATDIVAAMAVVGAFVLQDPIPGLIVVLMQNGGELLERRASRRASSALRALGDAAPQTANRINPGTPQTIDAAMVEVGDELIVRPGEAVPCDGVILSGIAELDTSRLTGEPLPVAAAAGDEVKSGTLNGRSPFTMRATATAADSAYASIVDLVKSAQESKAPLQRLADRYAVWFTPVTIAACVLTWLASGSTERVLAVLVIATPCPLILATPMAVVGGISRAARAGILVRHGGALEMLARVTVAAFDKTGTLTMGKPRVAQVRVAPGFDHDDVLSLAASVEQGSGHLLARVLIEWARMQPGWKAITGTGITELPGGGVSGLVNGSRVSVGSRSHAMEETSGAAQAASALLAELDVPGSLSAVVTVDGAVAAVIVFADEIRPDAASTLNRLAGLGITQSILLSGDDNATVAAVARSIGIATIRGEMTPADKAVAIRDIQQRGERVAMIGDGSNDAPALSAADVGIALAAHGGGVTAESADIVILSDRLLPVATAVTIARRTVRIAHQGIWVGLIASGVGMAFAAAGQITPVAGALLQEVIDLVIIGNALRASRHVALGPV